MEKILSQADCLEYITKLKELEVSCYQQHILNQHLKYRLSQAQRVLTNISNRQISSPGVRPHEPTLSTFIVGSIIFAIPGGILGFIWRLIQIVFTERTWKTTPIYPYLLWGVGVAIIIAALLFLPDVFFPNSNSRKQLIKEWESKVEKQKEEISCRDKDIQNQRNYIAHLQSLIQQCENNQRDTFNVLKHFYELGYVYPKYRGIIPICTICEYMESGRCVSLTGADGAYNLYEQELLMKTIINKLDDIIEKLDDISFNQRLIAREIQRSQSEVKTLLTSLDNSIQSIEQNAFMTEYYSRVSAANTNYLAWVEFLNT